MKGLNSLIILGLGVATGAAEPIGMPVARSDLDGG